MLKEPLNRFFLLLNLEMLLIKSKKDQFQKIEIRDKLAVVLHLEKQKFLIDHHLRRFQLKNQIVNHHSLFKSAKDYLISQIFN